MTKLSLPLACLAASGFLLAAPLVSPVRAGSAVASDEHGGYGYASGNDPQADLEREAIRRCREKSAHPDDVHLIVTSRRRGAGIIVRYIADGQQHVFAYVGAENDRQASDYVTNYVDGYGGKKIEVVARWRDEN